MDVDSFAVEDMASKTSSWRHVDFQLAGVESKRGLRGIVIFTILGVDSSPIRQSAKLAQILHRQSNTLRLGSRY